MITPLKMLIKTKSYKNLLLKSIIFIQKLIKHFVAYSYTIIKFYKVLCYSKMTLDWFPMINPYIWPFSFFRLLTEPYFYLWKRILPNLRLEKTAIEVSNLVALECLDLTAFIFVNSILYFGILLEILQAFLLSK